MSFFPNTERNWFPVIVAGLTVLLALVFYATNRSVDVSAWISSWFVERPSAQVPVADPVTEEEYQQAVRTIIRSSASAQEQFDALIQLRVPGSMQTFHIDLIIAAGKIASDDVADIADGEARFSAIFAQYPWLAM